MLRSFQIGLKYLGTKKRLSRFIFYVLSLSNSHSIKSLSLNFWDLPGQIIFQPALNANRQFLGTQHNFVVEPLKALMELPNYYQSAHPKNMFTWIYSVLESVIMSKNQNLDLGFCCMTILIPLTSENFSWYFLSDWMNLLLVSINHHQP